MCASMSDSHVKQHIYIEHSIQISDRELVRPIYYFMDPRILDTHERTGLDYTRVRTYIRLHLHTIT